MAECVISPCGHIGDVPTALRADWARAHVQVFDYITEAQRSNDPLALERGLKWYLVLHDVLLRGARRASRGGGRGTTYLAQIPGCPQQRGQFFFDPVAATAPGFLRVARAKTARPILRCRMTAPPRAVGGARRADRNALRNAFQAPPFGTFPLPG